MRNLLSWGAAQLLYTGTIALSQLESRVDCPSMATTTIFEPFTIYATAPVSTIHSLTSSTAPENSEHYSETSSSSTTTTTTTTMFTTVTTKRCSAGSTTPASAGQEPTSVTLTETSGISPSTSIDKSTAAGTSEALTSQTVTSADSTIKIPTSIETSTIPIPTKGSEPSTGYTNAVYFTNWGIYGADYQPQSLPASDLTHVIYAFADISADGTVHSSDGFADVGKHYAPGGTDDAWATEPGHNAYGVVKQLYLHKQRNRGLKTLLSVGGWSFSPKFAAVAASDAGRRQFATSAVRLMVDYGMDGLDLDWEYPASAQEAADFVLLLRECRAELDAYAEQYLWMSSSSSSQGGEEKAEEEGSPYHFLITVASPAGAANYGRMDLRGMNAYVDSWHLMAYDYAGSWDATTGHQSNLFADAATPAATKFSTDDAVRYYVSQGVAPAKIVLGLPLYGRAFEATTGLGEAYSGVGTGGVQPGVWLYSSLPRQGAVERWDDVAKASWSYDGSSRELISYDTVRSAEIKMEYVMEKGLGGAFFWEASGDRTGDESLVGTASKSLRGLDKSFNNLKYPTSQYDNIRKQMKP